MNPSAPSFKPAGGSPTPAIEGPIAAGTTAVDASLAIVPPRERQVGVVDHRVTPEALARLEAMNTPVPIDRMSTTSAVNSDEAMPYGPTLNMGFSQYNTQQHLHVSLDRSAEVAAVAEARHAELMTKRDAQFVERLGAIQANAQAEYARLGKELDVSNQTIINQQREFAARMGYGQQQLDEAITTAIQAQKQNHDLQVSLVRAQAKAEEEAAKSDAIRRQMEAEARFKDESMQKELDSMRQALEDMRAQIQSAPGGGAASALQSDLERPPPTVMGPSPGREAPGPVERGMPSAEIPVIPIFTPPGLGPKPKDDGPPDDDDDDGSDEDKHKKDKKSKKDKKRRKKKKRRSSSSSSSSDSSQVGKQMLKAIMKQLKKGSKKDKRSDDEGTDGEKPKNKAKEAEKITFPKFPLPEQYRNWRIRVAPLINPTWLSSGCLRCGQRNPQRSSFATRKGSLLSMLRFCLPSLMCWKASLPDRPTPSKSERRTPGGLFGVGKFYSGLMITLLRMPCMVRFTTLRTYWQLPSQTRISLCSLVIGKRCYLVFRRHQTRLSSSHCSTVR